MLAMIALFLAAIGIGALTVYRDDPRPQLALVAGISASGCVIALAGFAFLG